jgi:hypothetical protein
MTPQSFSFAIEPGLSTRLQLLRGALAPSRSRTADTFTPMPVVPHM